MIEANKPGLKQWINENIEKYNVYKVICEYENGLIEPLDEKTYNTVRKVKSIKFMPLVAGAKGGGLGQTIVGAVLIAAAFVASFTPFAAASPYLYTAGASMLIGGVIQMLSPRASLAQNSQQSADSISSTYFDGPVNNEAQGSPVPLVYGRVLVGSHTISSSISINEAPI